MQPRPTSSTSRHTCTLENTSGLQSLWPQESHAPGIYGLITISNMGADFLPMNSANNWLHLVLGLAKIGLGLWLGRDATKEAKPSTT